MKIDGFREELAGLLALLLVVGWAALEARSFPPRAGIFPMVVATSAALLILVELTRLSVRQMWHDEETVEDVLRNEAARTWIAQVGRARRYVIWIAGFYTGVFVIGFLPASFLFVALFLWRVAHFRWLPAGASAAALLVALVTLGRMMRLSWHEGWVAVWLGLV